MKTTIVQRLQKAEAKAKPLIEKYGKMDLDQILNEIRNNKVQYRKDQNIITRYLNLNARSIGFAGGIDQAGKEL